MKPSTFNYIRSDLPTGVGTATFQPGGDPARSKPLKISAALRQIDTSRTWAMTNVDQLHPDLAGADRKADIPEKTAHGSYHLALHFDGTIAKATQKNIRQ